MKRNFLPCLALMMTSSFVACNNSKSNDKPGSAPQEETTDGLAAEESPETEALPQAPTDETVSYQPQETISDWNINSLNCAAFGYGYDAERERCMPITSRDACNALGNNSKFVLEFGIGRCIGPKLQPTATNCAAYGEEFDSAANDCAPITTQEQCDALNNGSIFDAGYHECIGPKLQASQENCAAFGKTFDPTTHSCQVITTKAQCDALNSMAIFDTGYNICIGRCEYRRSIIDDCPRDLYYY